MTGAASDRLTAILVFALPLTAALGPLAGVGPVFAFRLVALALGILALAARGRPGRLELAIAALGGLWLTASLFSLVLSPIAKGWSELLAVGIGFVLAWALARIGGQQLRWFCRGWTPAFALAGGIAVGELLTGRHLPGYRGGAWRQLPQVYKDPGGTFVNPNLFAVFLLATIGFSVLGSRLDPSRRWRVGQALVAVGAVPLLVATRSVLALLALLVGVAVVGVCSRRTRRVILVVLAAGFVVGVGLLVGPLRPALENWVAAFERIVFDHRLSGFNSFAGRLALTVNGVWLAVHYPLTGGGPGSYEHYVMRDPLVWTYGLRNPHNALVEIASQYGLIVTSGVLAVLVWWAAIGLRGLHAETLGEPPGAQGLVADPSRSAGPTESQPPTRADAIAFAVVVGVVTFPVVGLCNSTFLEPSVTTLFAASLPLLVACSGRERAAERP